MLARTLGAAGADGGLAAGTVTKTVTTKRTKPSESARENAAARNSASPEAGEPEPSRDDRASAGPSNDKTKNESPAGGAGASGRTKKPITLKAVAEHVGLSPATVSLVLNRSPVADSIPKETHERVFAAARQLDYRPNYHARSLRRRRSHSIGVLVPEINDAYASSVMEGIEEQLHDSGYFYLVASHRASARRLDDNMRNLQDRSVEGFVLLATPIDFPPPLPTVAISGHSELPGVTNVVLDHDHAARLALEHLVKLGHERIAFFKGHKDSSDTEDRWQAIAENAAQLGVEVRPELTLQLASEVNGEGQTQEEGYREGFAFGRRLLERGEPFTTLFAFNDVSAIGAMRAFLDAGLKVPGDVSVVGFDDIQSAAFLNPSLTTVRQPLRQMGQIAGRLLLARLDGEGAGAPWVTVQPELVVRESTAPVPSHGGLPSSSLR
ncbi:MAG: LacI family transcriptional regulator [Holophagales bacterium]|nr:LacI family transcriptional regulator [Holophagales bacterium]